MFQLVYALSEKNVHFFMDSNVQAARPKHIHVLLYFIIFFLKHLLDFISLLHWFTNANSLYSWTSSFNAPRSVS